MDDGPTAHRKITSSRKTGKDEMALEKAWEQREILGQLPRCSHKEKLELRAGLIYQLQPRAVKLSQQCKGADGR